MKKISEHTDRESGWIKGYIIVSSIIGLLLLLMTLFSGCSEDPEPKFCWDCFVYTTIDPGAGAQELYSGSQQVCDKTEAEIADIEVARTYAYVGYEDGENFLVAVQTSCTKSSQ